MAKKKQVNRIVKETYLGKLDLNKYFRELLVESLNRSENGNQKFYIDEDSKDDEKNLK